MIVHDVPQEENEDDLFGDADGSSDDESESAEGMDWSFDDSLASVNVEKVKLLLRPAGPTTADRQGTPDAPVLFDWQHNWPRVRELFQLPDVQRAAVQHVRGQWQCRYCSERWPPPEENVELTGSNCIPPFPLLLDHSGWDVGSDGDHRAEIAFAAMPSALRSRLIAEEAEALAEVEAEDEDERMEAQANIEMDYRDRCFDWLRSELDDARLLYSFYHPHMLPLLFRLATLLAPIGAVLELRVTEHAGMMTMTEMQAASRSERSTRRAQQLAWKSAVCYDTRHHVVYSLDARYFKPRGEWTAADALAPDLQGARVTVRRWVRNGGTDGTLCGWLRFRRGMPLEVLQLIQRHLALGMHDGFDTIAIPRWLGYE